MTRRFVDPDHANLRKAGRVALVMTGMTVLGQTVITHPGFASFAAFGSFALLGFADFAGPLRVRFGLGLGFTAVGAALVVLGTLASGHIVAAAATVLVVGFVVTFSGSFGGYAAAGANGLILAVVLAVMVPGGVEEIGWRVAGWVAAGLIGSVAMVVLWPERPRPRIRSALADRADSVAALVREAAALDAQRIDEVAEEIATLREQLDTALSRPSGPRARDQALLYLLDALGRATTFVRRVVTTEGRSDPLSPEDRTGLATAADLLGAAADTLRASPTCVQEESDEAIGLIGRLDRWRADEIARVSAQLDDSSVDASEGRRALLERFDVLFPVRMLSYLSMSIASDALVARGRTPPITSFEFQSTAPARRIGRRDTAHVAITTIRAHLRPGSRWFRNALRVGVALAVSSVVASLLHFDHSFWVVLGTLSVLRSSVMDTGASAIQSVVGTLLGFVVSSALVVAIGEGNAALWVLLPIAVFAAGYLPGVVSYLIGQAAFTVLVVVLFNLIDPTGWQLGLVRLEAVLAGVSVSVMVALVMWPRGVSHDLARAVVSEVRTGLRYLRAACAAVLGTGASDLDALETVQHAAIAARVVAESELGDLMNSRGSKHLPVDAWAHLVVRPHGLLLGADWLRRVADQQGEPSTVSTDASTVRAATTALARSCDAVFSPLEATVVRLERPKADQQPGARTADHVSEIGLSLTAARDAVAAMLADPTWIGELSERQVLGLLWVTEWAAFVADLAISAADDVALVDAALRASWWR